MSDLSNIVVGFFTLGGSWGTVWLKDHLDNKKISKSTVRQKAIEAYAISGRIMYSLTGMAVICKNLLRNKNFDYAELWKDNSDLSSDLLEKLELLIVENFYDLKPLLKEVSRVIIKHKSLLLDIVCGINAPDFRITTSEFENEKSVFTKEIIAAVEALRNELNEKYINNSQNKKTIFDYWESIKQLKYFFCK